MPTRTGRPTGRPRSAAPKELTAFRLPPEMVTRLDRYAEQLQKLAPWANVTRADAVRALLTHALDALEGGKKPPPPTSGSSKWIK